MAPTGELILEELERRSWGQDDLARILNRPSSRISELVRGKLALSPELAVDLAAAFKTSAEYWLEREAAYRLSLLKGSSPDVRRRARMLELAPVKDMQKRGWVPASDSVEGVEKSLLHFFQIKSADEEPSIHGAMRKTAPSKAISTAQRAWAFQVRRLAGAITSVGRYDESRIPALQADLRKLAAYSKEVRKVPALLMSYGIRFVVVEGLPGAKIDGFATWMDADFLSPVIGMSLRFDRLDSFWFTLGHEVAHIKHRDAPPVDADVSGEDDPLEVKPLMERRADEESANTFVPADELKSFINRAGPFYSTEKINQFATRIKMHPNIIVGQLKKLGELKYSMHTRAYPVRELVVEAAITDGWGKSINRGT